MKGLSFTEFTAFLIETSTEFSPFDFWPPSLDTELPVSPILVDPWPFPFEYLFIFPFPDPSPLPEE